MSWSFCKFDVTVFAELDTVNDVITSVVFSQSISTSKSACVLAGPFVNSPKAYAGATLTLQVGKT
ncbi:hypothetical protein [Vibrio rhodolitus]|uniref:hypothetical protein n=1 Tax=Vibrio rhodolitus TaxID=2231649 RepID=UPI000F4E8E3B|nr:hypothetical protein [Vibrio rhodolitus]